MCLGSVCIIILVLLHMPERGCKRAMGIFLTACGSHHSSHGNLTKIPRISKGHAHQRSRIDQTGHSEPSGGHYLQSILYRALLTYIHHIHKAR
ncbi:hypothetical protein F5Y13DRAFT_83703 [Hypoxylon sp. FL1857]|nr:hypothetical protein F5Y13DRAFT_83703 [Hypoxylon sp. FL1857]